MSVEAGSTWRRNHDGTRVVIHAVEPWPNTDHRLILWRRIDNNRRGDIWEVDFLRRYTQEAAR